jgi:hypothetical protein
MRGRGISTASRSSSSRGSNRRCVVPSDHGCRRQHHLPLGRQTEPVLRDGRSQRVPAEPLEPVPLVGRDPHAGIEVEPLLARGSTRLTAGVTAPGSGHLVLAHLVLDWHRPAGTRALARPGAERERPLHGRPRHTGQHRRVLCPLVRRAGPLVAVAQAPTFEQAPDARHDRREHIRDIRRREQRGGIEAHVRAVSCKHPIDDERMTMNI